MTKMRLWQLILAIFISIEFPFALLSAEEIESKKYVVSINPKLSQFVMILLPDDDVCMKIQIFQHKKLKQEIKCFEYATGSGLVFEDINFDGYKDMMILSFSSANYGYTYWLFDQTVGVFVEKEEDTLWNPSFDKKNKTLITLWTGPNHSSTNYFQFIQGKKILMKNIYVEYTVKNGKEGYRKIIKERQNGKMVITSDKMFQDPNEALSHYPKN